MAKDTLVRREDLTIWKKFKRFTDSRVHLKYWYASFCERLKVDENIILIESFHGKTMGDSSLVCAREIERLWPGRFRIFFATNDLQRDRPAAESIGLKAELLDIKTRKYAKVLATAGYIISNASLPSFYIRRDGQKYLQTWHGTPLKTLGKSMREGIESMFNVQHNFIQASHLLYPNDFTRDVMMRDYNLERLYTGKVVMCGYPRNEIFLSGDASAVRERYGLRDKKVYAYMPTWRGKSNHEIEDSDYFAEVTELFSGLDAAMSDDQLMFVNFHPIIGDSISFEGYKHIRPFPKDIDSYEFLNCTDALVTDYSSVFFDYSLTGKPVVLFMYDYDQYMADRGMYMDVRDLPFRKVYGKEDFIRLIADNACLGDEYDSSDYAEKFLGYDAKGNTEKLMRLFIGGEEGLLKTTDFSANKERRIKVLRPYKDEVPSTEEKMNQMKEMASDGSHVALMYASWFDSRLRQLLYDAAKDDKFDFLIITGTTPRTYLTQVLKKLGSIAAAEKIRETDIKRCFGDLDVDRKFIRGGGVKGVLKRFSFRKNAFSVTAFLPDRSASDIKGAVLKLDSKTEEKNIYLKADARNTALGCVATMRLDDADAAGFAPIRWHCGFIVDDGGIERFVRMKNMSRLNRMALKLRNVQTELSNGFIVYPYLGMGNIFKLCYKEKNQYDTARTRLKEAAAMVIYMVCRPLLKKKKYFIVYEKFSRTAQDNSYYFFKYCMEQLPESEKKRFRYVIDKSAPDYQYVKKYEPYVIQFMSVKHMVYAMAAKLLISTDSVPHLYAWQTKPSVVYSRLRKKGVLFLQHGVTAMKRVDYLFGKHGSSPMKYFVATSGLEQQIIVDEFGYKEENAPVTGFTRWDALEDKSDSSDPFILVMPTWRAWLEDVSDEVFVNSDYYRSYHKLLTGDGLRELLGTRDVRVVMYLHPKFAGYVETFRSGMPDGIELIAFGEQPLNELMMRAGMLITDYSSVCWDMLYMDKPVVFFQFDTEKYMQAHGSYIDLEHDLPSPRVTDADDLIREVEKIVDNGFRMDPEYEKATERFFANRDRKNCERTYEFLKRREMG